jgi:tetratricopeptide (TPR) repeat protein
MKKTPLLLLYILILGALGYFIGNRIYVLDAKEAIVYVFYYAIFLILYLILTVWVIIKTIRSKNSKKWFLYSIFLTWILMIGFPVYNILLLQKEEQQRQIELKKQEHIEYLQKLLDINEQILDHPDSSELYLKKAWVYRSNGLYEKAIIEAKKSIELKRTSSGLWELGWNYEILDEYGKAKTTYLKAKKHFPNEEWIDKRLAVVNRKIEEMN